MKLELENVGKISLANIELNGITVIAGENNILDRKFMDNWDCKEILDNYEGEIY